MRQLSAVVIALAATSLPAVPRSALAASEVPEKAELLALMAELRQIEIALEYGKRVLPPSLDGDISEDQAAFKAMAQEAELSSVELRPAGAQRVAYADGRPAPVGLRPLEISGRGRYQALDRLLARVTRSLRLFDLQALSLKAAPDDTVAFTLRLGLAYCIEPCSGHVNGPATFQDAKLDELVARRRALDAEQLTAQAKGNPNAPREAQKEALEELRLLAERRVYLDQLLMARSAILERRQFQDLLVDLGARYKSSRRIVAALEGFTLAAAEAALALTDVRFDGHTTLQGVALGAGARQGLRTALESAGFEVVSLKTAPAGDCQAFTATAKLKPGDPPAGVFLGNGLFDDQATKACSLAPRPPPVRIEVKGKAPEGGIDVHLRDVEAADAIRLLHEITAQGFVVDPDITTRLSADVENATLEEVVQSLGTAGLVVGPGTLRRVSAAGKTARVTAPARPYSGQPISVSFKAGDLRDILCLFKTITGAQVWTPRDLEGHVIVFARETPWDEVLDVAAASLGLFFVNEPEKERAFLGPEATARDPDHPGAVEPCGPSPARNRTTRLQNWRTKAPKPETLSVSDLKLAALAQIDGTWYAYAQAYSTHVVALSSGQSLLDGKVTSIGPRSVSLETSAGLVTQLSME